jgi:hypothetical protein
MDTDSIAIGIAIAIAIGGWLDTGWSDEHYHHTSRNEKPQITQIDADDQSQLLVRSLTEWS